MNMRRSLIWHWASVRSILWSATSSDWTKHYVCGRFLSRGVSAFCRWRHPRKDEEGVAPVSLPPFLSADGLPVHPGIVARADKLVACDHPDLANLASQLLGQTFIVRDMSTARAVAAQTSGYRFITLQGELLETDGTLTVGAHHAETGILSRKSELRELRLQSAEMEKEIGDAERRLATLREQVAGLESGAGTLQQEIDATAEQAADFRSRISQRRQRREGLHEEMTLGRHEMGTVEHDLQTLHEAWQQARTHAEAADRQVQVLQTRLEQADREIRAQDQRRQERQQELTSAKVTLATVEER